MEKIPMLLWCIGAFAIAASAQQMTEITSWQMQDSAAAGAATGEAISASSFTPTGWYTATVPGTVLATLVDQNVHPDPYIGVNMVSIPDLAKDQKRYWFRGTFTVTAGAGQQVWLDIEGINYQAYIFVNGQSVGAMHGAFKGGHFDITSLVTSGTNYVAVKIRGNYYPGEYHKKNEGSCGPNGGVMSRDGPTFIASQGWDWIPTIPDRDMGIWKPVYIRITGPVAIRNPWIRTTNVSPASAKIPLQVTLQNATASPVAGTANAAITDTDGSSIQFQAQTVTIDANSSKTVTFPELTMTSPKLWWPNGYGEAHLYTCNISFAPDGGAAISDTTTFPFGVREWSFTQSPSLILSCNGKRILCRGGNWGMDDAMKRWDLHKTENKVRYHKEMNFNMLRDWIGMTDNEPFYRFCDKYGIILWADFWEPHQADQPNPIDDHALYIANLQDKILRARNHASIAIWCARNESNPTPALLTALKKADSTLDGTRRVQPSSGSDGCHSGGPYTWTNISRAYNEISGFHTEFGSPTVPSYESFGKFIPEANFLPMPTTSVKNAPWNFHDYCSGNGHPENYTQALNNIWGAATSGEDLCKKAQLLNYDEYRASFEALQVRRFSSATGLLLWMSNCVWPSTMWQTYDYYMEGTGAMYGSMKGSEPIHVMYYGTGSYQISVVNNTQDALSNYTVSAATYNLDGTSPWNKSQAINVDADAGANAFAITAGTSAPYFLDLKLRNAAGTMVSKNFYWLPADGTKIANMLTMTKATMAQIADALWTRSGQENTITFQIVNQSAVCAVACRLQLTGATNGTRILPVHYNDNYFSLAPGDTQSVVVKFDEVDRGQENPKVCLTGVNVDQTCITIGAVASRRGVEIGHKTGMSARCAGNKLRISNVGKGKTWQVALFDMNGRMVLTRNGIGKSDVSFISLAGLRCGAYVAAVKSCGELYRTLVTIAKH